MRGKLFCTRYLMFIVLFAGIFTGCARQELPLQVSINAKSVIIMEAGSGETLFERLPDKRFPPASTAKVMTAVVAVENAALDKKVIVTGKAVRVEPTVAGLRSGVQYRLKDLLAAILIKSANDAAVAIAEGVAGSEEKFVKLMNRKAREIGMENTFFANASGLPTGRKDAQYTTARDLGKLMRYALRHKVILELMSKKKAVIYGSDKRKVHLKTHNRSLFLGAGASWGKTGYTKEVRRTFVGTEPSFKPRIVFSLLKSNDLWNDIAALKKGGLEIYGRKHRTVLSGIVQWVVKQRHQGMEEIRALYADNLP